MEVSLEEPKRLEQHSAICFYILNSAEARTSKAAVTDSSHRSSRNSSNAIDSLSTLIIRWHNWGRKNSMSSYGNWRSFEHKT